MSDGSWCSSMRGLDLPWRRQHRHLHQLRDKVGLHLPPAGDAIRLHRRRLMACRSTNTPLRSHEIGTPEHDPQANLHIRWSRLDGTTKMVRMWPTIQPTWPVYLSNSISVCQCNDGELQLFRPSGINNQTRHDKFCTDQHPGRKRIVSMRVSFPRTEKGGSTECSIIFD